MPHKIDIPYKSIVFTVVFIISLWVLYLIREVVLQFFVALFIMAILNPLVTKLSKYKIPRGLSVLVVYLLLIGAVSFAVSGIIPPLVEQTTAFINGFPSFVKKVGVSGVILDQAIPQVVSQVVALPARIATLTLSLFSNILGIITVLVFAFYLLVEREKIDTRLGSFFGDGRKDILMRVLDHLEQRLGTWARGQLTLMVVVGLANFLGLSLLGIPFALPLAILAGLLEIVPYIGPILAAIPAVIIGFGISPFLGLAAIALAFLVQQLENYVFVPKIMQRSTGVDPIITLLGLAIGFELAGVVGILISVPVIISLQVLLKEYLASKSS